MVCSHGPWNQVSTDTEERTIPVNTVKSIYLPRLPTLEALGERIGGWTLVIVTGPERKEIDMYGRISNNYAFRFVDVLIKIIPKPGTSNKVLCYSHGYCLLGREGLCTMGYLQYPQPEVPVRKHFQIFLAVELLEGFRASEDYRGEWG